MRVEKAGREARGDTLVEGIVRLSENRSALQPRIDYRIEQRELGAAAVGEYEAPVELDLLERVRATESPQLYASSHIVLLGERRAGMPCSNERVECNEPRACHSSRHPHRVISLAKPYVNHHLEVAGDQLLYPGMYLQLE